MHQNPILNIKGAEPRGKGYRRRRERLTIRMTNYKDGGAGLKSQRAGAGASVHYLASSRLTWAKYRDSGSVKLKTTTEPPKLIHSKNA